MKRDREIREALGAVIRDSRRARGLTLKALAELADLDWSQLSKIERGDSGVAPSTLERIGQELGFTLPALYAAALALTGPAKRRRSAPVRRVTRGAGENSAKHHS